VCMILSVAVGLGFVVMCLWRIEGFHKYLVPAFLLFPACAGYRMWKRCKPMTFDRRAGVCWPGRHRMDSTGHDKGISIDRIDCLQTLSQYNFDGGESYGCYELNLVLGDPPGERIHVMCHCSLRHHIEASFDLGEFIDKPVWDPDVEL